MDKKEIPFLTATELSKLIESKEISPVEATEAYLDRIEELTGAPVEWVSVGTRRRQIIPVG